MWCIRMPGEWRSWWLSYAVAVVSVAAAMVASAPLAGNVALLLAIQFTAVAVAGWYGGFGPAMVATALSYLGVNWLFVAPQAAFSPNSTAFVFVFICVAIAAFGEASRRAVRRARLTPIK